MEKDKIKSAYKKSKNIYDDVLTQNSILSKMYIKIFWGVDDNIIAQNVLSFIPERFCGKLLDIPVGTGVFTFQKYAKMIDSEITCIDYSKAMLNQAKRRFIDNTNIKCLQGDVGNIQFEDESFDIVLSMNGFHAFPNKDNAFLETTRVLKKGGLFVGCFYIKGEKALTDLVVNCILSRKGWFTPPFHTKKDLNEVLHTHYSRVEMYSQKSMVWFRCFK